MNRGGVPEIAAADLVREVEAGVPFHFVESVGRPDLGGREAEWTERLFDSLERARRDWPAALRVLPAHCASERERAPDRGVTARFGELPPRNEPLACTERASFRAWVRERSAGYPDAYRKIKASNLGLERVGPGGADEPEAGRSRCTLG